MGYTYCAQDCGNIECKRNQKHAPNHEWVSFNDFNDCDKFKFPWEQANKNLLIKNNVEASEINNDGLNRLKEMMKYVSNTKHH